MTTLGIPTVPPPTSAPTWKVAWDQALYGARGFYRREHPGDHFRTSVHASGQFAQALVRWVRDAGLDTIVDVGAGRGELLTEAHELDPGLDLLGVEVRPRPPQLPAGVAWTSRLPESVEGLVVANEWLDNVPCHLVEVDPEGRPRIVHVDPATGEESLGWPLDHGGVPASLKRWCDRWWPLDAEPGTRAEVGTSRDAAWADVVQRVSRGIAVAVDYGHTRGDRPPYGSVRAYRDGREVDVLLDGSRDVTADVAVDALADRVGGVVLPQAEALRRLGVSAGRPDLGLATVDPAGYVRALARASQAGELLDPVGLGGFHWVVSTVGDLDGGTDAGVAHPLRG